MTTSRYGDFTLYRRLARHTRSSWPSIAALFVVGLLATPVALLTPLPLKIAVDSILGSRPLPRSLDTLVPAAVARAPSRLLVFAAALTMLIALLSQLQGLASKYFTAAAGERLVLDFRAGFRGRDEEDGSGARQKDWHPSKASYRERHNFFELNYGQNRTHPRPHPRRLV